MEYAVQVDNLKDLKNIKKEYSRIYYGNEFCPHCLISIDEVKEVFNFCNINNKQLTIVTSYIIEKNMNSIKDILHYIVRENVKCEIIINDWGLLYYISKLYKGKFDVVLGCLLNKMKKSPIVMNVIHKVNEDVRNALETASINLSPTWAIIEELDVERVEFENALQGNQISANMPFEKSLRYPYIFITTARKCITNYCVEDLLYYDLDKCYKGCKESYLSLYNKVMKREVILKGNTLFYKNDILPDNFEKQFSRLVYNETIIMNTQQT